MISPKQTLGYLSYFQKQSLYQVLFSSEVFDLWPFSHQGSGENVAFCSDF